MSEMTNPASAVKGTAEQGQAVIEAFLLGWHVAELFHVDRLPKGSPEKDRLPGIGSLLPADRRDLVRQQVEDGLEKVKLSPPAELSVPELPISQVADLHLYVLKALTVRDSAQGSAYGLGRALAETVLLPDPDVPQNVDTSFVQMFDTYRIKALIEWLGGIDASLPMYSAASVRLNLDEWVAWVGQEVRPATSSDTSSKDQKAQRTQIRERLRSQGKVWYGLLSGAVPFSTLLTPEAYLTAGESFVGKIGGLAWGFLRTKLGVLLILVILGLTALLASVLATGRQDVLIATVVLLFGSVGVTAGGAASAAGQVLEQAKKPIWDAELVESVAAASLRLPDAKARQALALAPKAEPVAAPGI
jgi:hypothetical protein